MFEAKSMLYLYVESKLHAGAGRGMGAIDLPIQRDRATQYPILQSSGIKGPLRAEMKRFLSSHEIDVVFGPDTITDDSDGYAGALSVVDAEVLLFPVRSLAGVFAWITCPDVLERFHRKTKYSNVDGFAEEFCFAGKVETEEAILVSQQSNLVVEAESQSMVVLEEFCFLGNPEENVTKLAQWIAGNVLPTGSEYDYWKQQLPKKLCVVSDDIYKFFVRYATELQNHIRIQEATKTVQEGALWVTESLPVDTVMYAPVLSSPPRTEHETLKSGQTILDTVAGVIEKNLSRLQLGGNETTGQGFVALRVGK